MSNDKPTARQYYDEMQRHKEELNKLSKSGRRTPALIKFHGARIKELKRLLMEATKGNQGNLF